MKSLYSKILGTLVGAASGDALGAATECRTSTQILEYFDGYVCEFKKPPNDTFAAGNDVAMCTDDFWQGYFILQSILEHNKELTKEIVIDGLKKWYQHPQYELLTGPTTRIAIEAFFNENNGKDVKDPLEHIVNFANSKATNGGAMRIFPAGLLYPNDIDKAIDTAVNITILTHNNSLAVSGACAIAAAVSRSMDTQVDTHSIIESALIGAKNGQDIMKAQGLEIAGASVYERIKLAHKIGSSYKDWKKAIIEIANIIGNGLHVSESVPAVFGILSIQTDSPLDKIFAAVNIGNDTDTIATMLGAIVGATHGSDIFPPHYLKQVNESNNIHLEHTAKRVEQYIINRDN